MILVVGYYVGSGWYVELRMLWGREGEWYKEATLVMCEPEVGVASIH